VVVPAYRPVVTLVELAQSLSSLGFESVIIVDDGSGPEYEDVFRRCAAVSVVHLTRHAVNLGKGAALKTGMNYALTNFPGCRGVVTADADGQHLPEDIARVADKLSANPDALILGVRGLQGDVPLRSRVGNTMTRWLVRLLAGQQLTDTQTGLRGIPIALLPHLLRLPSGGYEFELDMLFACKALSCRILEEPIRTVYLNGNASSHFHPIRDSMRIYFLLFRFTMLSLSTALIDNCVFLIVFRATDSIGESQVAARLVAMLYNYFGARRAVFHSQQKHGRVLVKYVLLVLCSGLVSYTLIQFLHFRYGVPTVPAKLVAESFLFIANFTLQRDFVFTRQQGDKD
jgi:glycosyltransferase involved in cell wall biosynthesis